MPIVATWHASGELRWNAVGRPLWGFLIDRIDYRIAVSEQAREGASRWFPGDYDVIPNGVEIPPAADPGTRENHIVFVGRHDPRKGLDVLVRAWPSIRRRSGARLRLIGADPLAVRLLLTRQRVSDDGIDVLGFLSNGERTRELLQAKAAVSPATGQESFGLVLAEAFACATPVVASDIPGYAAVVTEETGVLVPPADEKTLADAVVGLLEQEERRVALGHAARRLAIERYSWDDVARRLAGVYELLAGTRAAVSAAR
jgi:phosphatidylinositol alpha-mannosyltransferase